MNTATGETAWDNPSYRENGVYGETYRGVSVSECFYGVGREFAVLISILNTRRMIIHGMERHIGLIMNGIMIAKHIELHWVMKNIQISNHNG
jgi:hypothetical protein